MKSVEGLERFGEVGEFGFLMEKFGLTVDGTCKASRMVIKRKTQDRL